MMTTERRKTDRGPRPRLGREPSGGRAALWAAWLPAAAVLLMVAIMSIQPRGVNDLWWQLKTGELIWSRHAVPTVDLFSHTAAGRPWQVQEWLAELLLFGLYHGISPTALVVYKVAGCTLIVALVLWRSWLRCRMPGLAAAVTAVAAYAAGPGFSMRPQLFSYLFLALALLVLDQWRRGAWRRAVWALPLLTLLWVNCHGGFVVIFALLAVEIAAEAWDMVHGRKSRGQMGTLLLVTGLCGLAGLLNPSGMEAYRYAFLLMGRNDMLNQVLEWGSPNFHDATEKPLAYVILLVTLAGAATRRGRARDLLLTAALLHGTLFSKRHMPLLAVASAPIVAGLLAKLAGDVRRWMAERRWSYEGWRATGTVGLGLLLAAGVTAQARQVEELSAIATAPGAAQDTSWFGASAAMGLFPVRACDFLMNQPEGGRLFNSYGWGGYCIWRLWPKYRVFVDGRAEVYFGSSFEEYRSIVQAQVGWEERLRRWGVDTIFIEADVPLAAALPASREWRSIYQDEQAVIYRRVLANGSIRG